MVGDVPGAGDTGKSQTASESHSLVEELRCEMTPSKTSSVAQTQGPSGLGQRPRAAMAQKRGGQGASLVAQWLRVCLPVQGTRVRALVWGDPTCRGATGPVSHNC